MSNPKTDSRQYRPDYLGIKSTDTHSNKGRKMGDKTGKHPIVIQTKGE